VVGELCGRERAEIVQLIIEYDPQPPFSSGHPGKARASVLEAARAEVLERARNPRDAISIPIIIWRSVLGKLRAALG